MVTTSLSLTSFTFRRQERTATPSTSTVQEPQCPSPQPNLVPVSPRSVRSTQSSGRSPSTFSRTGLSLSLKAIASVMRFSSLAAVSPDRFQADCKFMPRLGSSPFGRIVKAEIIGGS